ncbi:hypothetical protein ACFQ60_25075 [Streptomyces zhihengii]
MVVLGERLDEGGRGRLAREGRLVRLARLLGGLAEFVDRRGVVVVVGGRRRLPDGGAEVAGAGLGERRAGGEQDGGGGHRGDDGGGEDAAEFHEGTFWVRAQISSAVRIRSWSGVRRAVGAGSTHAGPPGDRMTGYARRKEVVPAAAAAAGSPGWTNRPIRGSCLGREDHFVIHVMSAVGP